ncbi:cohesin domain-containing protein [Candidatus Kryptobacter tengchongensis]|uniref:Cohesin domain-containing protein n=1 Tax=Kryptobacter tengchongensis TaxID=1643429 RepID=A0A916PHW5_KRYT1|nr:cohesin domain-containing protein [Candidatus Kryptobacter tengchongensis]CUS96785.1 Cohesin domain-containing protein [Candidatus Kryptobacter tengchongensis]
MNKFLFTFISLILISIVIISCEKPQINPFDPASKNYIKPSVELISGPNEGEKVSSNNVTFVWKGNTDKNEFRYKLVYRTANEVIQDWTPWSDVTTATFNYLDDGKYSFIIETRYKGNPEATIFARNWEVEAIVGPAVKFYKLKNVVSLGSDFDIELWCEDVKNVRGTSFTLIFDKDNFKLNSVTKGSLPRSINIEQVVLPDFSNPTIVDNVNKNGKVEITTGFISEDGLSGTGSILKFNFKTLNKRGDFNILAQNFILIDTSKAQIMLASHTISSLVQVK